MTDQERDRLPEILEKISELARRVAGGDYLYRGEPERYDRVSSSLYREYPDIEAELFSIEVVQQEILDEAKRFIRETNEDFILEQLQHFGYPTNQIDFTKDYHIALFFACDSQPEEDGRVLLLNKTGRDDFKESKTPENRVIAQKSVFVRPAQGFVEPDYTIIIPKGLKRPMLEYLDKSHGVNAAVLFNDIHGFIKYRRTHESAYVKFFTASTYARKKEYSKAIEHSSKAIDLNPQLFAAYGIRGTAYEELGNYNLAIQDFSKTIDMDSEFALAFESRGRVYWRQGNYNLAVQDLNKAIELEPDNSYVYYYRGVSYLAKEEWENAESDLFRAQGLGVEIAAMFSGHFGSVADFEQEHGVQLPVNIKAMLAPEQ